MHSISVGARAARARPGLSAVAGLVGVLLLAAMLTTSPAATRATFEVPPGRK